MNGNSWAIRLEMRRKLVPISKCRHGEEVDGDVPSIQQLNGGVHQTWTVCCHGSTWVTLMCFSLWGELVWSLLLPLDLGVVSPACLQNSWFSHCVFAYGVFPLHNGRSLLPLGVVQFRGKGTSSRLHFPTRKHTAPLWSSRKKNFL